MPILLNAEEIEAEFNKLRPVNKIDVPITDSQLEVLKDEVLKACQSVVKAQLKKVVEWLEGLPTDGHDKWYFYHRDLADKIKKEAGLT